MIQLIVGEKGKGKTKYLLDKVNSEIKKVNGSIVYLDKTSKHMYELNNRVRLIVAPDYLVDSSEAFVGFVSGIISQDHDLEQMYFDNSDITPVVNRLEALSEKFHVDFILSVSLNESDLAEELKSRIIVSM